jgi:hypothetical protein
LSSSDRPLGAKGLQLLLTWGAALALSALLVWSGRHWSLPLLEQPWALRPPLLLGLLLLRGLLRHPAPPASHPDRGESTD